jgi:ribosomal protein S18 acetylase RimI-like enzyme
MISIRKATITDIPVLIDFQQRLAQETENVKLDAAVLEKGLNALFQDPAKGVYYVAEEGSEVIACHLITYEWSEWRNGMVWWMQSVYVKENHRGKNVFRILYNNIIDLIRKDPGLLGLRLYVDKSNARAQKVYETIGMNGEHYTVFEWMKD